MGMKLYEPVLLSAHYCGTPFKGAKKVGEAQEMAPHSMNSPAEPDSGALTQPGGHESYSCGNLYSC